MSFIVGAIAGVLGVTSGAVVLGGAIVGGAAIGAKGQKKAAATAAAGSERELEFARESRDLARADVAPYQEAGVEALGALMSLTGLGGSQAAAAPGRARLDGPWRGAGRGGARGRGGTRDREGFISSRSAYQNIPRADDSTRFTMARAGGGHIYSRANGGPMYNVNEMGPENRYVGGAIRRSREPATIDGETGYVQPNAPSIMDGGKPIIPGQTGYTSPPMGDRPPKQLPAPSITDVGPGGFPRENPGGVEGGYQFQTDPGYQFRFSEGVRALDRSAAARGGLLSGGYGRALTRYGQGFASEEFGNVYNRISNIAGLGQVAAGQSGAYAMEGGAAMGRAAGEGAYATAYGQAGAANTWAGAAGQIAQLPWDKLFNRSGNP